MVNIDAKEYKPYIKFIVPGRTTVDIHENVLSSADAGGLTLFPTSGLIQELYPDSGAYIHTVIYKVYEQ